MPVELILDGKSQRIFPTKDWQELRLKTDDFKIDENYYIKFQRILN
jgi:hypothetical protein